MDYNLLETVEDVDHLAQVYSVALPIDDNIGILAEPVKAGNLSSPNSLAVHPMEGADGDSQGRPSDLTVRRYERFAAGGWGLLWAEAIAVVPEGRANPRQLWLSDDSKGAFADMVAKARKAAEASMGTGHKPVIIAQLTHSGRYSKPQGVAKPVIPQRDPYRDALVPQQPPFKNTKTAIPENWPLVSDAYLDDLVEYYVRAAKIAFEIGFDGVDIKSCHGYLLNEILACHNRPGKYGESFENRTRLLLSIIDAIHQQLGDDKPVVTRLGIYDAIPYPYGWAVDKDDYTKPDLTEPKKLFKLLQQRNVPMVNVTIANPYYNPHYGRPYNEPIAGAYKMPEHPIIGISRMVNLTGEMQKEFPGIALVGTGYSWLRGGMAYVGAGAKKQGMVTLVGGGRMAFAYPDFAKDLISGRKLDSNNMCIACSACTQIMRDGGTTGCVVRDNKVYGPIYKHGRLSSRDNLMRLGQECRKCRQPSCRCACPAGVNIPKFISEFLDGNDQQAYETIRESNVFPEICAWLCPVEAQCEGNCMQKFIGDGPLPIAEIQRYLAEQANKNGWSELRIPQKTTGKRIAVIGAGPAGLACAARLLEQGHSVEIFDKSDSLGGMVDSVIPRNRLGASLKRELQAIFKDIPSDRLKIKIFELSTAQDFDAVMKQDFDACFIGLGLSKAMPGSDEKAEGIFDALAFLNMAKTGITEVMGKRVAVIGGGNTAMDAACTAKRLGAIDVYVIYRRSFEEMPAWQLERQRALDLGVHFLILTRQLEYGVCDGKVAAIRLCPTVLGESDSSGRRKPIAIKESAYTLEFDVVIEAIGQQTPEDLPKLIPGVEFVKGLVKVNADYLTSRSNVFAGGDIVHGASTVVAAVADGMKAAEAISRYVEAVK
jgi:2,4-dienoyl-CoA reductase (NADPH2)